MKAKDLMLGDLVFSNNKQMRVYSISKKDDSITLLSEENGMMLVAWDVEPIPLSWSDVLEKIGFKSVWMVSGLALEFDGIYINYNEHNNNCLLICNRSNGERLCVYEVEYVHQLQHALSLCGIEREIKL